MPFLAFVCVLLLFSGEGCMTEEPEEGECITAFDCGEGYDCINIVCVEIPDDSGYTDKAWNDTGKDDGAWEEQEEGAVFFDDKIAEMDVRTRTLFLKKMRPTKISFPTRAMLAMTM
jgi:hypothetical protein